MVVLSPLNPSVAPHRARTRRERAAVQIVNGRGGARSRWMFSPSRCCERAQSRSGGTGATRRLGRRRPRASRPRARARRSATIQRTGGALSRGGGPVCGSARRAFVKLEGRRSSTCDSMERGTRRDASAARTDGSKRSFVVAPRRACRGSWSTSALSASRSVVLASGAPARCSATKYPRSRRCATP
jgi:hypothetical protein